MMWKRKCQRVKTLLALWVGRDLDEQGEQEARRHMAECPHCRGHWQRLQSGQQALEQAGSAARSGEDRVVSLWPELRSEISARREFSQRQSVSGWFPVGALAAACVAIAVLGGTTPPFEYSTAMTFNPRLVEPAGFRTDRPGRADDGANHPQSFRPSADLVSNDSDMHRPADRRVRVPVDYSDPRSF